MKTHDQKARIALLSCAILMSVMVLDAMAAQKSSSASHLMSSIKTNISEAMSSAGAKVSSWLKPSSSEAVRNANVLFGPSPAPTSEIAGLQGKGKGKYGSGFTGDAEDLIALRSKQAANAAAEEIQQNIELGPQRARRITSEEVVRREGKFEQPTAFQLGFEGVSAKLVTHVNPGEKFVTKSIIDQFGTILGSEQIPFK